MTHSQVLTEHSLGYMSHVTCFVETWDQVNKIVKKYIQEGRDISSVRNTYCSCRGSLFISQHLHGGPQLSIAIVAGNLIFLASMGTVYSTCYTDIYDGKHPYILFLIINK